MNETIEATYSPPGWSRFAGSGIAFGDRAVPERRHYVAPTILHGMAPKAEVVRDEVFGRERGRAVLDNCLEGRTVVVRCA